MRMRQSLTDLERAFFEEAEADRDAARAAVPPGGAALDQAPHRTPAQGAARRASCVLVLVLLATAVLVTVAMFRALYIVMG